MPWLCACRFCIVDMSWFCYGAISQSCHQCRCTDMSVCRVGDTYYMVSTTMFLMPGAPIMRSTDMLHWETVSYVFPRIDDGERYCLLGGATAYGQGQWASSIRYHDGKFYVWFTANGAPDVALSLRLLMLRDRGRCFPVRPIITMPHFCLMTTERSICIMAQEVCSSLKTT